MIEPRLFNLRSFGKAFDFSRKNHTVIYLIYKIKGQFFAVAVTRKDELEEIPFFYTKHLYFWYRAKSRLIAAFGGKIAFCSIPEFLNLLNEE